MQTATTDQILDMLKMAYVSFKQPNYAKLAKMRNSPLIVESVEKLSKSHCYTDVSDNNYDVGMVLLSYLADFPHAVYLSFVGNIAYVDSENSLDHEEFTDVIRTLSDAGWLFVQQDQLNLRAPFATELAGEEATLFHVLFRDTYEPQGLIDAQ